MQNALNARRGDLLSAFCFDSYLLNGCGRNFIEPVCQTKRRNVGFDEFNEIFFESDVSSEKPLSEENLQGLAEAKSDQARHGLGDGLCWGGHWLGFSKLRESRFAANRLWF